MVWTSLLYQRLEDSRGQRRRAGSKAEAGKSGIKTVCYKLKLVDDVLAKVAFNSSASARPVLAKPKTRRTSLPTSPD